MSELTIDSRVIRYGQQPMRIMAYANLHSGKILISNDAPFKEPYTRASDSILVVDTPDLFPYWDLLFTEAKDMAEVVNTYFEFKKSGRIILGEDLSRFNPESVLQTKKLDERGTVSEFDGSSFDSGHMAVLLSIWACRRAIMGNVISNSINGVIADDTEVDDTLLPFSV